jgi:hypothetical protein
VRSFERAPDLVTGPASSVAQILARHLLATGESATWPMPAMWWS